MKISFYEVDLNGYEKPIIVNKPAPVEAILFNYMSQLEEMDHFAYVFIDKYKDGEGNDRLLIKSYRTNWFTIEINEFEKISDRFVHYIVIYNGTCEYYKSLFDIDIPYRETFKLVKNCNDLYIEKIYN